MPNPATPRIERWPIVEVSYPSLVAFPELDHVMDELDRRLGREEPFALLHRTTSSLDTATRRYFAAHLQPRRLTTNNEKAHPSRDGPSHSSASISA